MKELGLYMKRIRELRGITQEDLAWFMNTPSRQIARWENGETTPSLGNFVLWIDTLDVNFADVRPLIMMHLEAII